MFIHQIFIFNVMYLYHFHLDIHYLNFRTLYMIHYMVLIKILHSLYLYHLVYYINNKHKNLHQHDINLFNLLLINYVIHYVLP